MVVITGASSGNGRAAAYAFAAAGAAVVLAARRGDVLETVAQECRALGGAALGVATDVTDPAQVEALGQAAVDRFGRIDVWINNAAVLHFGRLDETPPEILDRVVRTNVGGYLNGARVALRHFRARGRGVLINTSSILGAIGHPYTAAYGASKFAIRGLTESLRAEVRDQPGIQVCAVLPAAVDTPIYQRAANYTGRTVQPIRLLYPPRVVAAAMVDAATRPRREVYAGGIAPWAVLGKRLAPGLAERAVRLVADRMEIGRRPAPRWAGNLNTPVHDGYATTGGWQARYRRSAVPVAGVGLVAIGGLALAIAAAHRMRGNERAGRGS